MEIIKQLEKILYGYNYEVLIIDLITNLDENESLKDTLTRVLTMGEIQTGQIQSYSKVALISEITEKLSYTGDSDHGPNFNAKKKHLFEKLLQDYRTELNTWIDKDDLIIAFWVNENHPNSVFWGYAFFVESLQRKLCRILIGSSSD